MCSLPQEYTLGKCLAHWIDGSFLTFKVTANYVSCDVLHVLHMDCVVDQGSFPHILQKSCDFFQDFPIIVNEQAYL